MSANRLSKVAVVVLGMILLVAAQGHAGQGKVGEALTYEYYGILGGANLMLVNQAETTHCIPVPAGKQVFTYNPVPDPVVSCDPSRAKPIGVGVVANGGSQFKVQIKVGPFDGPVDVSLGIFAASFDATDIYFLNVLNQLETPEEIVEDSPAEDGSPSKSSNGKGNGQDKEAGNGQTGNNPGNGNGQDNGQGNGGIGNNQGNGGGQGPVAEEPKPKKKFRKLVAWQNSVTEVNEVLVGPVGTEQLEPGLYVLILSVTRESPSGNNFDRFYRWVTYFIIPDAAD